MACGCLWVLLFLTAMLLRVVLFLPPKNKNRSGFCNVDKFKEISVGVHHPAAKHRNKHEKKAVGCDTRLDLRVVYTAGLGATMSLVEFASV